MNICGVPTILRVGISAKAAPITIKDEGTVILPRMESGIAIAFGVWRLSTTIITDIAPDKYRYCIEDIKNTGIEYGIRTKDRSNNRITYKAHITIRKHKTIHSP